MITLVINHNSKYPYIKIGLNIAILYIYILYYNLWGVRVKASILKSESHDKNNADFFNITYMI